MTRKPGSARGEHRAKTSAVTMALLIALGFGVAIAGGAPSAAATYHGGSDACDATVSDGDSIQAAVDAASPGDTICVEAGSYDEVLTVNTEGLTLLGANDGVSGEGDRGEESRITGQVVLSADGVTFDGFAVSPPPATDNFASEAVRVSNTPDGVTVAHNVVHDFSEDGLGDWLGVEGIVAFGGDASDPIEDVTIADNEIRAIEGIDIKGGAAGIMVQGNVAGATVEHNVVTDVGREQTGWAQAIVVTGTGNHGEVPTDVTVVDNDLSTIRGNPASDWFGVGVGIETDGTGYLVDDNEITDTDIGVEVKAGADETALHRNVIEANAEWGALNTDDGTLDARDNWWGSPLGPTHESNAFAATGLTGDAVSEGVSFDPWCPEPLCLTGDLVTAQ